MTITLPASSKPRVLCLHGGGTNARIFRRQCRSLIRQFEPYYRLVFAEAPWASSAGPDVLSVYKSYGPFKRWLRWHPSHPAIDDADAAAILESTLRAAMTADDDAGHDGAWVGLLGFSQGAKIAASVLYETQLRNETCRRGFAGADWKFGVLLAARAPIVALSDQTFDEPSLDLPGALVDPVLPGEATGQRQRLRLPTVHVHGTADAGIDLHRVMLRDYMAPGAARVVEWSGDHRVPITSWDVERVVSATLFAAKTQPQRTAVGKSDEGRTASIETVELLNHQSD